MSQSNAASVMWLIESIMRDVPQSKRVQHVEKIKELAESFGMDPERYNFFKFNVSRWPAAELRRTTEIRYHVDFAHGEHPDHRLYGATFEEVRALLNYTPESCRVAFNTSRGNRVERVKKPTRLGPCVITKLPYAVSPGDYPNMRRLSDRAQDRLKVGRIKGNKYHRS